MPNVVILAGPNGAGKTSAAPVLLRDRLEVTEFVNADVIARGLSGFSAESVAVEAGRVMLRRLDELAMARIDFAFESTLSGTSFLRSIDRWRANAYIIRVVYLWLSSPDAAIRRVRRRVQQGGHSVPEDVIRRRYERSMANFASLYRTAADEWQLYDNTETPVPRLLARGDRDRAEVIEQGGWLAFERAAARISRVKEVVMTGRPPIPDDHVARAFADVAGMKHAMDIAAARVIRRHRLLNEPLVSARNGEIVYLDPHTVAMPGGVTEEEMGPVFDYL
jgi:predicted ABC-type ATPase